MVQLDYFTVDMLSNFVFCYTQTLIIIYCSLITCMTLCVMLTPTGWFWNRRGDISMPSRTTPNGGMTPATTAKVGKRSTVAAI